MQASVLRAGESDARALVTSQQQPPALVVALDRLGLPNTAAVRSGLALSLFRASSIVMAAEIGSDRRGLASRVAHHPGSGIGARR